MGRDNPFRHTDVQEASERTQWLRKGSYVAVLLLLSLGPLLAAISYSWDAGGVFLRPRIGTLAPPFMLTPLGALLTGGKNLSQRTLRVAGLLCLTIAAIDGAALIRTGTVDVVKNTYRDRLPESWFYVVVPLIACALTLFVLSQTSRPSGGLSARHIDG